MSKPKTSTSPVGLCSFQDLPASYQKIFQQCTAHHLSENFLPAKVDWFTQVFLLPFSIMYALPPLTIPPVLLNQLIQEPESFSRFWRIIRQQNATENAFTLVLFVILGLLLVYCAWFAWNGCLSFVRTWQASQFRRRHRHGFGLVMLESGLVARLIDNIGDSRHNCFWLPREAIANVVWQRIREEGAKHSRWVYRTQICYVKEHNGQQRKYWLTLKGYMFELEAVRYGEKGDRPLFDQLYDWWERTEDIKYLDDSTDS